MVVTLDSHQRVMALRSGEHSAQRRRVDSRGLDKAYRAVCARRECERRLHLVRRRNLTNPLWNGLAL